MHALSQQLDGSMKYTGRDLLSKTLSVVGVEVSFGDAQQLWPGQVTTTCFVCIDLRTVVFLA